LDRVKKDGFSLDDALTVELGFSARLLGQHIIDDWGMSKEIIQSLRSSPHHLDMNQMGSFSEIISRVCEIGEVVAQVKNDKFYPQSKAKWTKAENDLTKKFGDERAHQLEERFEERIKEVRTPGNKPTAVPLDTPQFKIPPFPADELFHQNRYITDCPKQVQERLLEIYKDLEPGKLCLTSARVLCNDVIPSLGFNNGALFIFEPERLKLVPRFRVGDKPLQQFTPAHCQYDLQTSAVARAFQAGFPSLGQTEDGAHFISGTVGREKKAGVLYLELTDAIDRKSEQTLMVMFKALLHTLSDCLNV
ncbi:MAG: hypothetical protein KDD62_12155, partial [Bdellovibrionales bacterium]|nr:hypothetical protein [Bdellovibrionales bacterium]